MATSKFISRGHSGAYVPGGPLAHGLEVVYGEDLCTLDLGCGELALGVLSVKGDCSAFFLSQISGLVLVVAMEEWGPQPVLPCQGLRDGKQ